MKLDEITEIDEITEPLFAQLRELGELWDDDFIAWTHLKRVRKFLAKHHVYALKFLLKRDRKQIKRRVKLFMRADTWYYKIARKEKKQAFKAEKTALKQQKKELVRITPTAPQPNAALKQIPTAALQTPPPLTQGELCSSPPPVEPATVATTQSTETPAPSA